MPELGGFERLVRRNDDAVPLVVIGGDIAVERGRPVAGLGQTRFGRVLRRQVPGALPTSTEAAPAL